MSRLAFLRGFLRDPKGVASVVPSSRRLVETLLDPLPLASARVVVEYGPGVGTFTAALLARMAPEATLVAIDPHPDFIAHLRHALPDPRLVLVQGSAADVEAILDARGLGAADAVVSGLPFTTLPAGVGPSIVAATHRVLRPGAPFAVYQFRPAVGALLAPVFARVGRGYVLACAPPMHLFWAWKS